MELFYHVCYFHSKYLTFTVKWKAKVAGIYWFFKTGSVVTSEGQSACWIIDKAFVSSFMIKSTKNRKFIPNNAIYQKT